MTDQEFNQLAYLMLLWIRHETPYKTGRLCLDATQHERMGSRCFKIYVDEDEAPYFKYVNGKGKHKGYWKKAIDAAIKRAAREYGGYIERS